MAELRLLDLSTYWYGFDLGSACMRIFLDKVTVEHSVLGFTLSLSFHQYFLLNFVYMLLLKERLGAFRKSILCRKSGTNGLKSAIAFFLSLQRASVSFMIRIVNSQRFTLNQWTFKYNNIKYTPSTQLLCFGVLLGIPVSVYISTIIQALLLEVN